MMRVYAVCCNVRSGVLVRSDAPTNIPRSSLFPFSSFSQFIFHSCFLLPSLYPNVASFPFLILSKCSLFFPFFSCFINCSNFPLFSNFNVCFKSFVHRSIHHDYHHILHTMIFIRKVVLVDRISTSLFYISLISEL